MCTYYMYAGSVCIMYNALCPHYAVSTVRCLPASATPSEALIADKVIVSVPQLLQLAPHTCLHGQCSETTTTRLRFVGAALIITITCSNQHEYEWCSSPRHYNKNGVPIFYTNLFLAASCLLSGNAYNKIAEMMKFMGLRSVTNSTFYRYQSTYFIPTIETFWSEHQKVILSEHGGRDLVVFGDGRCDSPGSSAALCTYTIMDNDSGAILSTLTVTKSEVCVCACILLASYRHYIMCMHIPFCLHRWTTSHLIWRGWL